MRVYKNAQVMVAKHAPHFGKLRNAAFLFFERGSPMSVKKNDKYEEAQKLWLEDHLKRRSGERKRRLKEGHAHAERKMLEQVWWPAFGSLEFLHPEFQVIDYHGGPRYLDFAYIRPPIRIAIEVLGFGPHQRDISRRQYCDQWVRHVHLVNDGWIIVYIGYDDVVERPRLWQQIFQQMIGKFFGSSTLQRHVLCSEERDIIRLAIRLNRPIKLSDLKSELSCGYKKARKHLASLEEQRWLLPLGKATQRIHSWQLNIGNKQLPM
jgi:hypothetical protein